MTRNEEVRQGQWAELRELNRFDSLFFVTGNRKRPMSDMMLSMAMRRMGYSGRAVPHGFRAMGSAILNERGLWNPDAVERQLAHRGANKIRVAYNRAEYLEEHSKMMRRYADYIRAQAL